MPPWSWSYMEIKRWRVHFVACRWTTLRSLTEKKTTLCVAGLPTQAGPIRCSDLCVHQMAGAPHIYIPGSQSLVLDQPHHLHLGTNQKCIFSIPTPDLLNRKLRGRGVVIYVLPDPHPHPSHPFPTHIPRWFWCKLRSGLHQINETILTKRKNILYLIHGRFSNIWWVNKTSRTGLKKTDVKRRASFATLGSLP